MVRVTVVGGGVNAIGSALALLQRAPECQVTVISKDFSPNTTGDGAAGFWGPYLNPNTPEENILRWSQETWDLFLGWVKAGQQKGVSLVSGACVGRSELPLEFWHKIPIGYRTLTQEECTSYGPDYCSGYSFTSIIAEPSHFLPRLMNELRDRGVVFKQQRLTSLEEAAAHADLVLNCTGLGAYDLVPDHNVYPCRGQVMRVKAPWQTTFLCDDSDENIAYILPNCESVVLGGTNQNDDWRQEIDPKDSEAIWNNCTHLVPSLKKADIIREWAGLRPCRRKGVRLEADEVKIGSRNIPVVHNYGHGGCGVTMFWGCSTEAASIAADLIHKHFGPTSKL
ncbi:D-amino-acid oxidase-like [Penaeus indicus]|uniref:D-amino-acid oxidase-like n=1 Tax=Penaeus indicus TaxID=29960 RepID=UPI00300CCEFB